MPTRSPVPVRRRTLLLAVAALVAGVAGGPASAEDTVDGALWRLKLTNAKDSSKSLVGQFRLLENGMYQKPSREAPEYSKRIGTNHPDGKRTRFEVKDLRVFRSDRPREGDGVLIKGTGRMMLVKVGEWNGLFTDGRGDNWELSTKRIQE